MKILILVNIDISKSSIFTANWCLYSPIFTHISSLGLTQSCTRYVQLNKLLIILSLQTMSQKEILMKVIYVVNRVICITYELMSKYTNFLTWYICITYNKLLNIKYK